MISCVTVTDIYFILIGEIYRTFLHTIKIFVVEYRIFQQIYSQIFFFFARTPFFITLCLVLNSR